VCRVYRIAAGFIEPVVAITQTGFLGTSTPKFECDCHSGGDLFWVIARTPPDNGVWQWLVVGNGNVDQKLA
jgi:hypothetical protein